MLYKGKNKDFLLSPLMLHISYSISLFLIPHVLLSLSL